MTTRQQLRILPALKRAGGPAILRRAADILNRNGWIQGVNHHKNSGRVDIQGALALASGAKDEELRDDIYATAEAMGAHRAVPKMLSLYDFMDAYIGEDPATWNDKEGRTKERVVSMLNGLADQLDALL